MEEAAVTNVAEAAIAQAVAAIRRAATKSMGKAALKDKADDRQKDVDYGKVGEFCRRLEVLGQQRSRRRKGAAWKVRGKLAETEGPKGIRKLHPSAAKLVHNDFLPNLYFYEAEDEEVTRTDEGYDGGKWRNRAPPKWQQSEGGTVTLPHIDYHDYMGKKDNTMGTRLGLWEGEEVVVAWEAADWDGEFEEGDEWFAKLTTCASLAVVHAKEGDVVQIAEGAWHFVVTVKAKKHLAWHL